MYSIKKSFKAQRYFMNRIWNQSTIWNLSKKSWTFLLGKTKLIKTFLLLFGMMTKKFNTICSNMMLLSYLSFSYCKKSALLNSAEIQHQQDKRRLSARSRTNSVFLSDLGPITAFDSAKGNTKLLVGPQQSRCGTAKPEQGNPLSDLPSFWVCVGTRLPRCKAKGTTLHFRSRRQHRKNKAADAMKTTALSQLWAQRAMEGDFCFQSVLTVLKVRTNSKREQR